MNQAAFIGVSRHRIDIDGKGVTTLAAFHGCPLRCRYCLNPQCHSVEYTSRIYTPEFLFQSVSVDNLYFLATGGGVTFGGGEPLLYPEFIAEFRQCCGLDWHINVETSLHVSRANVERIISDVDHFIVDIKDVNPQIYKSYTGLSNRSVLGNLKYLVSRIPPEHLTIRVPLIPRYNTETDVENTVAVLKGMGVTHIDKFDYVIRKAEELR